MCLRFAKRALHHTAKHCNTLQHTVYLNGASKENDMATLCVFGVASPQIFGFICIYIQIHIYTNMRMCVCVCKCEI